MRSALFYLLHSSAIVALMVISYYYGVKQSANEKAKNIISYSKKK